MKKKTLEPNASLKRRGKIQNFLLYFKSFLPLILSHHPECERFQGHTIKIGKYGLCIGCFVGYPAAIIGLIIIRILNLGSIIPSIFFFIFGIVFIASFIASPLNLIKTKSIKIIQKIIIGIGSSFLFYWILDLPININFKFNLFLIILWSLLSLFNLHHIYSFYKMCKKCQTPFEWATCSGFNSIKNNLHKYRLNDFFKFMTGLPKLRIRKSLTKSEENEKTIK